MVAAPARDDQSDTGPGSRAALLVGGLAAFVVTVAGMGVLNSDHTREIAGTLFFIGMIAVPFVLIGTTVALVPARSWWTRAICVSAGYLLLAVMLGVAGYMTIPARYLLEDDTGRGSAQSFSEMHGEELAYAESYRESDPARYAFEHDRVSRDRRNYIQLWAQSTGVGLLVVTGLTFALNRLSSRPAR